MNLHSQALSVERLVPAIPSFFRRANQLHLFLLILVTHIVDVSKTPLIELEGSLHVVLESRVHLVVSRVHVLFPRLLPDQNVRSYPL